MIDVVTIFAYITYNSIHLFLYRILIFIDYLNLTMQKTSAHHSIQVKCTMDEPI